MKEHDFFSNMEKDIIDLEKYLYLELKIEENFKDVNTHQLLCLVDSYTAYLMHQNKFVNFL